jgi:hypothetical protein
VKAKPKRPDIAFAVAVAVACSSALAVACSPAHPKICQPPKTVENPATQTKQSFSFAPEIGVSVPPTPL